MKVPEDQLFVEGNAVQVTFPLWLLCSYEWFLCGLHGVGSLCFQWAYPGCSASLCPWGMVRTVLSAAWGTALPVSGTWAPMWKSRLPSFSILLKITGYDHTAPQHSWKRCCKAPVFPLYNHENDVTVKANDLSRHITFGVKLDSILLDSSSSGAVQSAFCLEQKT